MDLYYPVPHDWQAFERLVKSIAEFHFPDGSVQLYGRQGQSQGGIDVLVDARGTLTGIQCKHYLSGLRSAALTRECDAAKEHFSARHARTALATFIAATTALRDVTLQDELVGINASHRYPFQVKIWFWEDINEVLNRSVVAATRYQQSIMQTLLPSIIDDHKGALARAFDRHAFLDGFADGEGDDRDFLQAMEDTDAFLSTGILRDRSGNLLRQTLAAGELPDSAYRKSVMSLRRQVSAVVMTCRKLLNKASIDRSERLAVQAKVAGAYEKAQRLLQQ